MKSKCNKTCFIDKLNNNLFKDEKAATSLKYYIYVGIAMFLLATLIFSFFGVNLSNQLKNQSVITVDYKNTLTASEYNANEKEITKIVNNAGDFTLSFQRGGVGTSTKLFVNIINKGNYSKTVLATKLEQVTQDIEEHWSSIPNLEVSDAVQQSPYISNLITSPLIAGGLMLAALFVFMWIRFELATAIAMAIAFVYNVAMLLSTIIILRIPLTLNFSAYFAVSIILLTTIYMLVNDSLRRAKLAEKKLTNQTAVTQSMQKLFPSILLLTMVIAGVLLPLIVYLLIIKSAIAFTFIWLILAHLIGVFTGLILAPSIWAELYNREKDKRLKNKLKKQKEQEENKNQPTSQQDKIIV